MRRHIALVLALATLGMAAAAEEIGFIEDFSLAADRAEAIKALIPGTEDYYYYTCLLYQQTGQLDKVRETLKPWIERYNYTARVEEIRNRQALLEYEKDPAGSLAHIRDRLGLQFNHQKRVLNPQTHFPTRLDDNLIGRDTLTKRAFSRFPSLAGFEDAAFDVLARAQLNPDQRRHLLQRLQRPDYPGLPALVIADLKHPNNGGFGYVPVHRAMLLDQLDQCLKDMPELIGNTSFINTYIAKLRPNPDVDWEHDPAATLAYLDRLWGFVERLAPAQNSLKAHVLYQRLLFDRRQGAYDKARFVAYMQLPRPASYVSRDYLNQEKFNNIRADLNADYRPTTLMPPVGNDEALVRDYLQHFLVDAADYKEFVPLVDEEYLKQLFAETKIVNGIGDMEQWYSWLPPARYKALKERIDLEFLPDNPEVIEVDQPVKLRLAIKNVPTLIVKVYEINTFNIYRTTMREVNTAVDLDGLVANHERLVKYEQPPLRRHVEAFDFPEIARPGVFVVEFIGNGQSSRALVRKGRLIFTQRLGAAGHVFAVYDHANARLKDATLWLDGVEYTANEEGEIAVPFTNRPGPQSFILRHGDMAALHSFQHVGENYQLAAGMYVDREALLPGKMCKLTVRPLLTINGTRLDIKLLEEPKLTIVSSDRDGIATSKEVPGFELQNDAESVYEFKVPENLAAISFRLQGKVKNLSRNAKDDLADAATFTVNGIDATEKVAAMHFRHTDKGYVAELHGKTGEPLADRAVQFTFKHRLFTEPVVTMLQTDAAGRIALGPLSEIDTLSALAPDGVTYTWTPARDRHSVAPDIHAPAGDAIRVPFMSQADADPAILYSLLEVRDGSFVKDWSASARLDGGFLVLTDLPAGDYSLWLKPENSTIRIRVTAGAVDDTFALSRDRLLQVSNRAPLQIEGIDAAADGKTVSVQVANAGDDARVHLVATRYQPAHPLFEPFLRPPQPLAEVRMNRPTSPTLSGRNIGDEFRYVLERQYAAKLPGNMLKHPSLLLAPWSLRKTDTGEQVAAVGEAWEALEESAAMAGAAYGGAGSLQAGEAGGPGSYVSLDFLPSGSVVLPNLKPDKNGVVTVDVEKLGPCRNVFAVAVDANDTVVRELALPEAAEKALDIRLTRPLPPDGHYAEQKKITPVLADAPFGIPDITTSKLEVYDSLDRVYALFGTLSSDPTLAEFGFVVRWPSLKDEEKQTLYSKYACHELNFFLSRKDPAFFDRVIKPFLKNKKDKTFVDHYLIGDPLDAYLEPWPYGRLNIVERILLARHLEAQAPSTARHVKDLFDLIPPDVERFNLLFKTAIKGSALETEDRLGLGVGIEAAFAAKDEAAAAEALADMPADANAKGRANAARQLQSGEKAKMAAAPPAPSVAMPPGAAPAGKKQDALRAAERKSLKEAEASDKRSAREESRLAKDILARDGKAREQVKQFYRKLDKTEEWVENNYWHLPIEQQVASLVTVNGFWKDYAAHTGGQPFLSANVAEASHNFTEMMLALAVLDLPFKAGEHKTAYDGPKLSLQAASPLIAFHREIRAAAPDPGSAAFLVSQNFYAYDDRYRFEDNERFDKFVTAEFVKGRVYGCQVVLTNPTSSRRKIDVLLQIPEGAMPVLSGFFTKSVNFQLEAFSTQTVEYSFYFPYAGEFRHYPVHVAQQEKVIGFTAPFTFKVVDTPTVFDKESWDFISQNGTPEEVLAYLDTHNIDRLDLDLIAFRMRDKDWFGKAIALLRGRHVYQNTLWSYGIFQNLPAVVRDYLQHSPYADACGLYIDTPLLTVNPIARYTHQFREYWPMVNARVYRLGGKRQILNRQFFEQYTQFMTYLGYKPKLSADDQAVTAIYMLLQDRLDDAMRLFDGLDPAALSTAMQYDYLSAYLAFSRQKPDEAAKIAAKYREYPVERWRNFFRDVLAQADEIAGKGAAVVDDKDRTQQQTQLADSAPALDFVIEAGKLKLDYRNLKACTVSYYPMDVELLFSRNPFVQDIAGHFSVIRPAKTQELALPEGKAATVEEIAPEFREQNVMVEIAAGGVTKAQGHYPNALNVQITENYGQLRVSRSQGGAALPKVYIKVYARMNGGEVRFYKDGYTDLRGRFDYTSLNTDEIANVERFAILVMSEGFGSAVREATPPKM